MNLEHLPSDEMVLMMHDKLELYRMYLREWLPVFINGSSVDIIQVFDSFAGPGFDVEGYQCSPAIRCEEIHEVMIKKWKDALYH